MGTEAKTFGESLASVSSDYKDKAAGRDKIFWNVDEHFRKIPDHISESEQEADETLEQNSDDNLQSVLMNNIIESLYINKT